MEICVCRRKSVPLQPLWRDKPKMYRGSMGCNEAVWTMPIYPLTTKMGTKQGKMAEWSIAAVLKTVDLRGSGGSNPSLSAKKI